MARVLVPLADGCEEIETITIIDLLRRADIEVTTAALDGRSVTGSHGIRIGADTQLSAVSGEEFDMVVLPGGLPGADNLQADADLKKLLCRMARDGKRIAAICAAPRILAAAGLLDGRRATSFPGFLDGYDVDVCEDPVVIDGPVVTSRGPGTAMDFALALIEQLRGTAIRTEVESRLQRPRAA